ncbi:2984_t:CDS:2 [Funneliformis mosseae]|uniref:2984_t:CDS:1 n=1 Tax=Funneliformis mosseae TaxID=27381 RepID=A0A9N9GQT0_FUNMO|nr:2984_t:CDS:2 [Funneliformis mosseae]
MPMGNLEEDFKLARKCLLEFDNKNYIAEESAIAEDSKKESKTLLFSVEYHLTDTASFVKKTEHTLSSIRRIWFLDRKWEQRLPVHNELDMPFMIIVSTVLMSQSYQGVPPYGPALLQPRMIVEVRKTEELESLHNLAGEYFPASTQTNFIGIYQ